MREISCDFFEEHDTEGDAAQKDEAARPSIGDVVGHEVPAGEAKDEGGIQEEEGVVEALGDGFRHAAGAYAVVVGHEAGYGGAGEGDKPQPCKISLRQPCVGEYMFDPVAHEEVERRLADREERVYKVVHLRAALENEKGNDRHAANEEKIEPDEVEIEILRHGLHQFSPDGEHQEKADIYV